MELTNYTSEGHGGRRGEGVGVSGRPDLSPGRDIRPLHLPPQSASVPRAHHQHLEVHHPHTVLWALPGAPRLLERCHHSPHLSESEAPESSHSLGTSHSQPGLLTSRLDWFPKGCPLLPFTPLAQPSAACPQGSFCSKAFASCPPTLGKIMATILISGLMTMAKHVSHAAVTMSVPVALEPLWELPVMMPHNMTLTPLCLDGCVTCHWGHQAQTPAPCLPWNPT